SIVMQVFDNGASDGQTIVGTGAAPDLVEDYQAACCGVVQDVGRLDHLNHEGTLARCQVVLGTDAREDAIDDANRRSLGGNIAPDLRHQGDERDLAQVG